MNQPRLPWGQVPLKAQGDHRINDKRFFKNKRSFSSSLVDRGVRFVYYCGPVTLSFLYHEAPRSIGYIMSLGFKQRLSQVAPPRPLSLQHSDRLPYRLACSHFSLVVRGTARITIFSKSFRCTLQEHVWWSIFTHVANSQANLLGQKMCYDNYSCRIGWVRQHGRPLLFQNTQMATVTSCNSL